VTTPPSPRPHVSLHYAQSVDGRIGLPGSRAHLSSRDGVVLAHRARAESDAVLVGRRTIEVDDPQLTVRACPGRSPRRVVLASALDVPLAARALAPGPGVLVIGTRERGSVSARRRLEGLGAEVRLVPAAADGLVSLADALREVRAWGVERLLVEGGARVLTSFLRERLVDVVTVEIAPCFYGAPAICALGPLGGGGPEQAIAFADLRVERVGPNVVMRGRVGD